MLNGCKAFATGAQVADRLVIAERAPAPHEEDRRIVLIVDGDTPGLRHLDDWDGIGMRRSASGGIEFTNVFVPANRLVAFQPADLSLLPPIASLSTLGFQAMFVNIYVGMAKGALEESLRVFRAQDREPASWVLQSVGGLASEIAAAAALAQQSNAVLEEAVEKGPALTAEQRGDASQAVIQAKIVADRVVLEVSSRVFEISGARGATRSAALDRFRRDARMPMCSRRFGVKRRAPRHLDAV